MLSPTAGFGIISDSCLARCYSGAGVEPARKDGNANISVLRMNTQQATVQKRYHSKIGLGIVVFIVAVIGLTLLPLLFSGAWFGVGLILPLAGFIVHLFATTHYTISGNSLVINSGFLFKKRIQIDQIEQIRSSRSLISSPACSLDRTEIKYSHSKTILLSPKDQSGFVNHLKSINGQIVIQV